MSNGSGQGSCRAEIDHQPVISIMRVGTNSAIPGKILKGGYGVFGSTEGIEDGSGDFDIAVMATGMEVDLDLLKKNPFTFTFTEGLLRKQATNCKVTNIGRSNNPGDGTYVANCKFIFGELIATGPA